MKTLITTTFLTTIMFFNNFAKASSSEPSVEKFKQLQSAVVNESTWLKNELEKLSLNLQVKKSFKEKVKTTKLFNGIRDHEIQLFGVDFRIPLPTTEVTNETVLIATNETNSDRLAEQNRLATLELQEKLNSLLSENIVRISNLKILSILALRSASAVSNHVELNDIEQIYQLATQIRFDVSSEIETCIEVRHAKYTDGERAYLPLFGLFGVDALDVVNTIEKHKRYTETNCASSTIEHRAQPTASVSLKLNELDKQLGHSMRVATTKLLRSTQAPTYPTIGSPYFK